MSLDPVETNPDHYKVIFENDRVRVLEYTDNPGDHTTPHQHPDSVMYTLSAFERRLIRGDQSRNVRMEPGRVNWIAAQEHSGENSPKNSGSLSDDFADNKKEDLGK